MAALSSTGMEELKVPFRRKGNFDVNPLPGVISTWEGHFNAARRTISDNLEATVAAFLRGP